MRRELRHGHARALRAERIVDWYCRDTGAVMEAIPNIIADLMVIVSRDCKDFDEILAEAGRMYVDAVGAPNAQPPYQPGPNPEHERPS